MTCKNSNAAIAKVLECRIVLDNLWRIGLFHLLFFDNTNLASIKTVQSLNFFIVYQQMLLNDVLVDLTRLLVHFIYFFFINTRVSDTSYHFRFLFVSMCVNGYKICNKYI